MQLMNRQNSRIFVFITRITAIFVAAILVFYSIDYTPQISAEEIIRPAITDIKADSYIVIDRNTGETVIEYNSGKKINPASLTKVLTSIIAIETLKRDDVITISEYAGTLPDGESKLDLIPGETMLFEDMLFGMLLVSGNDAAVAVGEHIGGSRSGFADLMNNKSEEIGTKGSSWTNPSGVTDASHYSTSADLALLTSYALRLEFFKEVVSTPVYSLPPTNKHPFTGWNVLENTNKILRLQDSFYDSQYIDEIIGVKTGTTSAAGSNLITAAHGSNGLDLICVINGVRERDARFIWIYTLSLLEAAAKTTEGVQQIIDSKEKLEETGTGLLKYPEKSLALYNPDQKDYNIAITQENGVVQVKAGGATIFTTKLLTISDSSSQTSQSSVSSHQDPVPVGNDRTLIIICAIAILLIYPILIWLIIQSRYNRRRKKKSRF
ncbi:MAG: D-alanyl-D-alanine carboxypeptidase family protein [Saccharofermentanales bacterium]